MVTPELKLEIKQLIIQALQIPDIEADEIEEKTPIFEQEILDLDSIDAVELVAALQRKYGVRMSDQNLARSVLYTVDSMAQFVAENQDQS